MSEALEAGLKDLQSSVAGAHAICGGPDFPSVTFVLN